MTSIFYYTARIDFRQCISRFSGDFPLFFARFGPENFPVAPNQHHSFGTCSGEPGNTGLSLLPVVCFHIHSKTACRGFKSFCPCQKDQHCIRSAGLFRNGSGRNRGTRSVARGAGRRWRPSSADRGSSRDQVLLPLPQNRRKHWVFAGFLFACVAWLWCSLWFGHWVFSSGFTRPQPSSSPPAPETHPVSPFSDDFGCVFSFFVLLDMQNFGSRFCASCRIAFTDRSRW